VGDYPRTIAATFNLAIAEAVAQCQSAEALMAYFAQCAPERIPMTLVEGAVEDEAERMKALTALSEVSLVKHDPFEDGTPAVMVHRLVQAVAQERSKASRLPQDAIGRLIARLMEIYPSWSRTEPGLWPQCAKLMPHLLEQREPPTHESSRIADWADLLGRAGNYLHGRAAYPQAEQLFRDALVIREKVLGPEHPVTAISLGSLALLLHQHGDHAEAQRLYERALAINEKALGPEHPDTAESLTWLAVLLRKSTVQGDVERARPLLERALAVCEKALGPEHPETAMSLNWLAVELTDQGDYGGGRGRFLSAR
jgi:tetratricopeptide (TPR) repeat protein